MYDNSLANLRCCVACLLLSSIFWLIPFQNADASNFAFRTNQLDVAEGSTYDGKLVQSAMLVGLVAAAGLYTTAIMRVTLADGSVAVISKNILMNASKAYNLIGLCAANPIACGVIGASLAVTAGMIYLIVQNSVPYASKVNLDALQNSLGQSSPDVPYNFPPFWSQLTEDKRCVNFRKVHLDAPFKYTDFEFPAHIVSYPCFLWRAFHDSAMEHYIIIGNVLLSANLLSFVTSTTVSGSGGGDARVYLVAGEPSIPNIPIMHLTKEVNPITVAPVQPFHAPPILRTIPVPDLVVDPIKRSIPDIYNPVAIDGTEPLHPDNTLPPPPVIFTPNKDGGVVVRPVDPTQPVNPIVYPPVIDPVIPVNPPVVIDPTIPAPLVPTIPDVTVPEEVVPVVTPKDIADVLKEREVENNQEAEKAAQNAPIPGGENFNPMNFVNWGDSWLPAECPDDKTFFISGYEWTFSYSTVCSYAPMVRSMISVFSLIAFAGILVSGLRI